MKLTRILLCLFLLSFLVACEGDRTTNVVNEAPPDDGTAGVTQAQAFVSAVVQSADLDITTIRATPQVTVTPLDATLWWRVQLVRSASQTVIQQEQYVGPPQSGETRETLLNGATGTGSVFVRIVVRFRNGENDGQVEFSTSPLTI